MEPLTTKQQQILTYIEERLSEGEPPSQREIADVFGMVQNSVYQLIGYLRQKGYLAENKGHRGLRLSAEYAAMKQESEGLPIVGRVAAGHPILAEENVEAYLDLEEVFSAAGGRFLLRVAGDSMVDDGILNGDLVLVQPCKRIDNGSIGVVLVDDEATVKRVYKQKYRIALKSANKKARYKTLYFKPSDRDIRVVGKVVGCLRVSVK
ncbi:MAG: transcriptional repressor LexA [Phycisphaerae bacterium]|nr:transcriptional repressor LexA [Phycisphaerae bacterium]